jgi:hypothetical protein
MLSEILYYPPPLKINTFALVSFSPEPHYFFNGSSRVFCFSCNQASEGTLASGALAPWKSLWSATTFNRMHTAGDPSRQTLPMQHASTVPSSASSSSVDEPLVYASIETSET